VEALIIVGVLLFIVGIAYAGWYFKKKRREELALAASQLGLQYSASDPFHLVSLPFRLFSLGDGRGTENVLWGQWQGIDLKEFDYWYYTESTDSEGRTSRSYHYFSCAVREIPATCAHLTIEREGFMTRLADHLGFHDIEFESEDFNRAFQVKCQDRKFANDVVDARMMQWLLSTQQQGHRWGFEMNGPYVMCYTKRLKPLELVPLFGTLREFHEHIPRVMWSLYGTGAAGNLDQASQPGGFQP
jgi:hypothetical protein